jgi:hypothetical protein
MSTPELLRCSLCQARFQILPFIKSSADWQGRKPYLLSTHWLYLTSQNTKYSDAGWSGVLTIYKDHSKEMK